MLNNIKQVITDQIKEEFPQSKIASILICGSSKYNLYVQYPHPHDVDVICITNSDHTGRRYFKIYLTKKLKIEIEFIPNTVLDMYLTNYWWWPHNWDMEMSKYIYGNIILDYNNMLRRFKNKLKNYPETIRDFLILYRLGKLLNLKDKLSHKKSQYLTMELIRTYLHLTYPIYKKYHQSIDLNNSPYVNLGYLTSLLCTKDEDKVPRVIMGELEKKLIPALQKDKSFLKTFESLPSHYPDEVRAKVYLNKILQNKRSEDLSVNLDPIWGG